MPSETDMLFLVGLGMWISTSLHDLFLAGEVEIDVVDQAVEYFAQRGEFRSRLEAIVKPIDPAY